MFEQVRIPTVTLQLRIYFFRTKRRLNRDTVVALGE